MFSIVVLPVHIHFIAVLVNNQSFNVVKIVQWLFISSNAVHSAPSFNFDRDDLV